MRTKTILTVLILTFICGFATSATALVTPVPKPNVPKQKIAQDKNDTHTTGTETTPATVNKATPDTDEDTLGEEILSDDDTENTPPPPNPFDLPTHGGDDLISVGDIKTYQVGEADTLLDIARAFDIGFIEMRLANPGVDPWAPGAGLDITIPAQHLLPRAPQNGIVINLAEMRLYYFKDKGKAPITHPIGIGRDGLETPLGDTRIVRKREKPLWYPTERMREEKPDLPRVVPAGDANPLGTHALYLGWPTFLIHGTNKPWGIGRRVSSGCIRLYPEDIKSLFPAVPIDTAVTIVNQPVKLGWIDDKLYLEVHPSTDQSADIELNGHHTKPQKSLPDDLKTLITAEADKKADRINWKAVKHAYINQNGYPVAIADLNVKVKNTYRPKKRRLNN